MPYALLAIGVLIGLYGLYKFMITANPAQVRTMILTVLTGTLALALFLLAVTGRLPAAIAVLAALWPLAIGLIRARKTPKPPKPQAAKPMTSAEALEILGLSAGATPDDIQMAYKRLMMKVHPDQDGSEWMAAKLNAARDCLLP